MFTGEDIFGHVENIKDKVDYLFLPRYTSVSKKNMYT